MNNVVKYDSASNALMESLEAPPLDPRVLSIANKSLSGESPQEIAEEFDLPADVVSQVLEKPEVKNYVRQVYLTQGYLNRSKRLKIINNVIDSKLAEAAETGQYSKKDLYDWIKLLHDMERDTTPKERSGNTVAVQVNNNYENLINDIFNNDK